MDDVSAKVFVGSIDFNATEKDIEEAFRPYGDVVHVVLLRDKETQKSRGFGFVTFKEKHSVEAAIKGMNKQLILGRPIVVNYAEKKSSSGSSNNSSGANNPNNFNSQSGYGYDQQQANAYYQGYPGQQQGYWNQQNYGWGPYWMQNYGWGQAQGWNPQMQQQQQQQQQQYMGQQPQPDMSQASQESYNNKSGYNNTQSGY